MVQYINIRNAFFPRPGQLRYINWYLQHGCDLNCFYCKVPKQRIKVMNRPQRKEALDKLRQLSVDNLMLSIIGGETTLNPDLLVEAIQDATEAGFFVSAVTNGWGLTPDLLEEMAKAGLRYLAFSVDCDEGLDKTPNLEKALGLLSYARKKGIVPVVNAVITNRTNGSMFRLFASMIIEKGFLINPLACSPEVLDGAFSSAAPDTVPTTKQLREIILWLAWKKLVTGRIATGFGYLWTLFHSGVSEDGMLKLWHCAPHFRGRKDSGGGRGYLTLDSDGFMGPCQEFPRLVNLLDIPQERLSLESLEKLFTPTTSRCPGCLYNCYVNEEEVKGLKAVAEFSTCIQLLCVLGDRRSRSSHGK